MPSPYYITSYCSVAPGEICVNDVVDTQVAIATAGDFAEVYKHYQLGYAKFYKMDALCKLAFITSELLLRVNKVTEKYPAADIAIIIANTASSLESDTQHQQAISDKENYFPSPAVFVYTLPNIMAGEIAIRNKITGENALFIAEQFDADFMAGYVDSLLTSNRAQCCITGWVDFYDNYFKAVLYTAEKQPGPLAIAHTTENLTRIFK